MLQNILRAGGGGGGRRRCGEEGEKGKEEIAGGEKQTEGWLNVKKEEQMTRKEGVAGRKGSVDV